ncbi:MAG TPA: hypothetical protein VHD87_02525 [Acidimicrobiales bacterium]|nr:hypothetical protein [Acidimicrobiales bacterium]
MRRVQATFLALVALAVIAMGVLTRAVGWSASPQAGAAVAIAGAVAVITIAFAARILVVTSRGH